MQGKADGRDIQVLIDAGVIGPVTIPKRFVFKMVARRAMEHLYELQQQIFLALQFPE